MTFSPKHACSIWHDTGSIYIELASGLITKFPFTEGGLSKVLKLLKQQSANSPTNGHSLERRPSLPPARDKPQFSEAQKATARDIIRKGKH